MIDNDAQQHYFQARFRSDLGVLAAYQPIQVSRGEDTMLLFPPIGETAITLAGDPEDYNFAVPGQELDGNELFEFRRQLSAAITMLDLSQWLFDRSSRVNTPHSCAQLRLNDELETAALCSNLHTIYLDHLQRPDAPFELRCRVSTKGSWCSDVVDLARACKNLHRAAQAVGAIGSGQGQPVDIIIPTYGQPIFTLRCLASVFKDLLINRQTIHGRFDVNLQVVDDDHPQKDGHGVLQRLRQQGCVNFHVNANNLGFLESCNQAVCRSRTNSLVVLLNNDIEVLPGWLQGLAETFQQEQDVGLVGSKLIYPDGRLQEAGGIVWSDGSAWNLGRLKRPDHPDFNYARSADYISGASIMVPRSVWDAVGGFDRRYIPAYYEDTDLALMIRERGLKVIYQPSSQAIHHEGISNGTDLGQGIKAFQLKNQVKFVDKWRERLNLHQPNGEELSKAKHRGMVGSILVLENLLLDPEGDAGSLFMMNYCLALKELGYAISYAPMDNLCRIEDKALLMGSRGIQVLAHPEIESIHDIFVKQSLEFDLVLIARPGNYRHLEMIRTLAPTTPVAYFTHDLHFLRTNRTAANLTSPDEKKKLLKKSAKLKQLETRIFKDVDLVLHISEQENQIAQALHSHTSVVLPPVVSTTDTAVVPQQNDSPRQVLFVGNFAHAPNVTAAQWMVENIWPLVHEQRPELQLLIAGKNPPAGLDQHPSIQVLGYVENLSELLHRAHVGLAPLLEGAGVKGKVLSSLAHGLPMVTTSIGAEGIISAQRSCDAVRVADHAEELAALVVELSDTSPEQRQMLSAIGRGFIADHFSPAALISSFKQMLGLLQLPSQNGTQSFRPYQPRSSDLRFDQNNSFSHWSHPLA